MSDADAMNALREAFAGDDDASASWAETSPEIKAKCVEYVLAAETKGDRKSRAQEVARLAAGGPIRELGAGAPGTPDHLRHGFGGLLRPPGT